MTAIAEKAQPDGDVHVVGKNASSTKPAKFVVFFVKDKGSGVSASAGITIC